MGRGVDARAALRYRQPMEVLELVRYRSGYTYPVCPRCKISMEREYQRYCDRCGQRLGWSKIDRAQIISK